MAKKHPERVTYGFWRDWLLIFVDRLMRRCSFICFFLDCYVYRFEWINWNSCNFDIVLRNDGVCGSAEYGNAFLQFSFHERLSAAIVQESWWSVWLRVILERFYEIVVNKLFVVISVCAKLRDSYYVSVPVISCDSGDECLCMCQCASKPEMHLVKFLLPNLYGSNVW